MKMNFRIFLFTIIVLWCGVTFAQDYATGIQINEAVVHEVHKLSAENESIRSVNEEGDSYVTLPFFDDFSTSNIFPNQDLWDGYSVFVNRDFPYMSTNLGAATLDAIDSTGRVYEDATWLPFKADQLRSNYIRLDSIFDPLRKLSPADSIYLSFFYQPQGVGNSPQDHDSLVLEFSRYTGSMVFSHIDSVLVEASEYLQSPNDSIIPLDTLYAPDGCNPTVFTIVYDYFYWGDTIPVACDSVFVPEVVWDSKWYAEGMKLEEFYDIHGTYMLQVNIPVLDSAYFNDKFRFRFRNYASVSDEFSPPSYKSNVDQWNIDYVYLNFNRSIGDTTYRALTFSQRAPSFLKKYEVMPYRQYRYSPNPNSKTDFNMYISNLDNIEHNTQYSYKVEQVGTDFSFTYDGGSCNLKPFYEVGFQECVGCGTAHACPPVNALFALNYDMDTTSFIITHYISDSSDQNSIVDSAIYRQGFYNYYAYDDGTPELGYGIASDIGKIAYQFELNMADTLWGVQMYFNRTLNDVNEYYFDLVVWGDNNGKPGEELYRMEGQQVKWEKGLYSFYPYMLDQPLKVVGTVYVGFEQARKEYFNIGMDANNNKQDRIFAYYFNEWHSATVPGALLMRPIIGANMILSMEENLASNKLNDLVVYPNPASSQFSIGNAELKNNNEAELIIRNIYGQIVHSQIGIGTTINTTKLTTGIYIVMVQHGNIKYSTKLIIK